MPDGKTESVSSTKQHTIQLDLGQHTSNALMLSSKLLCRLGFKFAPAAFSIFPMLINWVR